MANDEIFHCVAISGISSIGKIFGYIEYFNFSRVLVELSDSYEGEDFYHSYSIDPTTGLESDIQINFNQDFDELMRIMDGNGKPLEKYIEALNYALPIFLKKNFEKEIERVITETAKSAFETLGVKPGESLELTHASDFASIMTEKMIPFLLAHSKNRFY